MRVRAQHGPILATAIVFVLLFGAFSIAFRNFFSPLVAVNLLANNAHLGVIAVGLTFVILSGGIDLSVGSVLAATAILVTALVERQHLAPGLAILAGLAAGAAFGALQGWLIHSVQLPPFLVTLAGMFLARGMAFVISPQSIEIKHGLYREAAGFSLALAENAPLRITALMFLAVFGLGLFAAHRTAFGRTVYAVGGNESSAVLMGLPVGRTKIAVYAISGFCAGLGGVVFTLHTLSADPSAGVGMELDGIAAVVIGGTLLTGGVGYMAGTMLGVLISGTILVGLDFHGGFDSSWQRIAVGLLLLAFIGLQRFLTRASGGFGSS